MLAQFSERLAIATRCNLVAAATSKKETMKRATTHSTKDCNELTHATAITDSEIRRRKRKRELCY
jgi:predicted small metal-binding protein